MKANLHNMTIEVMQNLTREELKMQLSQVQRKVYRNARKSEIITQIRLNIIVGSEQIGMGVKNE
jgi:hypothetical protein